MLGPEETPSGAGRTAAVHFHFRTKQTIFQRLDAAAGETLRGIPIGDGKFEPIQESDDRRAGAHARKNRLLGGCCSTPTGNYFIKSHLIFTFGDIML